MRSIYCLESWKLDDWKTPHSCDIFSSSSRQSDTVFVMLRAENRNNVQLASIFKFGSYKHLSRLNLVLVWCVVSSCSTDPPLVFDPFSAIFFSKTVFKSVVFIHENHVGVEEIKEVRKTGARWKRRENPTRKVGIHLPNYAVKVMMRSGLEKIL